MNYQLDHLIEFKSIRYNRTITTIICTLIELKNLIQHKNYWNSCLKKKLRRRGIDQSTHKPLSKVEEKQEAKSAAFEQFPLMYDPSPFFESKTCLDTMGNDNVNIYISFVQS